MAFKTIRLNFPFQKIIIVFSFFYTLQIVNKITHENCWNVLMLSITIFQHTNNSRAI